MINQQRISIILWIALIFLGLSGQAQNTRVTGQLKGLSDGTVLLFYNNDGEWITDTVRASNDRFNWKTSLEVPVRIALTADSLNYYFFAAPGHIHLTGTKDDLSSYTLSGSPMQRDADAFKKLTQDISHQWDSLFTKYATASDKEKARIDQKRTELQTEMDRLVMQFITDHPKSLYSMYLIGLEKEYEAINRLYNKLDESAKQTIMGKNIAERLHKLVRRQIGQQMPDFTQADTSGKPVNFNQFKSAYKYILVDFWASWCAPCRAENPNVLKAYQRYQDKGFTVIGISLDDSASRWKMAIRQDKMPWTQLSDLKGFENKLAAKLGIEFIPSNLLIDPSGKIIARDLRGIDLENKLKELMD